MPRKVAVGLILLGIALFLGSCVPLGFAGYRLFMAEPVLVQPVAAAGLSRTAPIVVAPEGLMRLAVKAMIETESVQEETSGDKKAYRARYRFPIAFRVLDAGGKVLVEKQAHMAWDRGEKLMAMERSTSSGGVISVQHNFEKFAAPASGRVSVEVDIRPDITYSARLADPQLIVYDKLVSETPGILAWMALFAGGMLLGLVGFIFAIAPAAALADAAAAGGPHATRYAAMCHAAGFLGYLVPLGNFLGVLVAWLAWRGEGAFVDQQGKEALNFQVAMLVYALVSLALVLVLVGFVLLILVAIAHLLLMVVATVEAAQGRAFRYPMIFRLLK